MLVMTANVAPTARNLFQIGDFTLHSGKESNKKIDCDALTTDDWNSLACWVVDTGYQFGCVVGVPDGGMKLTYALHEYIIPGYPVLLVIDDVWTTGNSILEVMTDRMINTGWLVRGLVVFARGKLPADVDAIFHLDGAYRC